MQLTTEGLGLNEIEDANFEITIYNGVTSSFTILHYTSPFISLYCNASKQRLPGIRILYVLYALGNVEFMFCYQ